MTISNIVWYLPPYSHLATPASSCEGIKIVRYAYYRSALIRARLVYAIIVYCTRVTNSSAKYLQKPLLQLDMLLLQQD